MYAPNFTVDNSKQVTTFKANISELIKCPMCLGSFSKDYETNSRKDTGLYGNVYDQILHS